MLENNTRLKCQQDSTARHYKFRLENAHLGPPNQLHQVYLRAAHEAAQIKELMVNQHQPKLVDVN